MNITPEHEEMLDFHKIYYLKIKTQNRIETGLWKNAVSANNLEMISV